MYSRTEGAYKYYYLGDKVVYPYDQGTPSSDGILAYLADPAEFPMAPLRFAATVMLVREDADASCEVGMQHGEGCGERGSGRDCPRVFMLHRVSSMAFAADAYVFPGGRVDDSDDCCDIAWKGPSASEWADALGLDVRTARSVVVAAARELYEECGVLLASGEDGCVGVAADDQSRRERERLEAHECTFAQVLRSRGMELRTDLLHAQSRWLTPETAPRRYDTFFFKALLPNGASADGRTSEASEALWVRAESILKSFDDDETLLLPPTIDNLVKLRDAGSAASFMAQRVDMSRKECELAVLDGKAVAICPRA